MADKLLTLRMTRETALYYGLLTCTCGHPVNNHFDHDKRECANCECQGFQEVGRRGITIVTPEKSKKK
jgi:hypothetical protein